MRTLRARPKLDPARFFALSHRRHEALRAALEPRLAKAWAAMGAHVVARLRARSSARKDAPTLIPPTDEATIAKLLTASYHSALDTSIEDTRMMLGLADDWAPAPKITRAVLAQLGERIGGINDTTRERVQRIVADGIDRGASIPEMASELDHLFGDRARASLVARTESATGYNKTAIASAEASDVVTGMLCLDSADCGLRFHDDDEKPNGQVYPFDVAQDYPISHPACRRAWAPSVG